MIIAHPKRKNTLGCHIDFDRNTSETPNSKRRNISVRCVFLELANDKRNRSAIAGLTTMTNPKPSKHRLDVATTSSANRIIANS